MCTVLNNCLIQQNVIQVHMIPTLDLGSDHVISIIYNSIRFISLNCLNNCMTLKINISVSYEEKDWEHFSFKARITL
jgi:spore coat protein U-like protein